MCYLNLFSSLSRKYSENSKDDTSYETNYISSHKGTPQLMLNIWNQKKTCGEIKYQCHGRTFCQDSSSIKNIY